MLDKSGLTGDLVASSGESVEELFRMALIEVNILNISGFLPVKFDGSSVSISDPVSIFSFDGKDLYRRIFLERKNDKGVERVGFFEFAVDSIYGGILLAVGIGEGTIRGSALGVRDAGGELISMSYPKVAVKLDSAFKGEGGDLFELSSGQQVRKKDRPASDALGFLDIRDLRETLSPIELKRRVGRFEQEKILLRGLVEMGGSCQFDFSLISKKRFSAIVAANGLVLNDDIYTVSRNSVEANDLRLFGQSLNEWCFPASMQMLFDFYRFSYKQDAIAYVLHLDPESGQELPKSTEFDVVSAIEKMTRGVIAGKMIRTPEWVDFQREIFQNRPAIGLIDGHCRLVIGANTVTVSRANVEQLVLRGLAILDPWPVDVGARICWENFDAISYVAMFGGELNLLGDAELGLIDAVRLKVNSLLAAKAKYWQLPEGARTAEIVRLNNEQDNKDGWITGVESGGKIFGFVELDKTLGLKNFYEPRNLGDISASHFLDKKIIKEKAKKNLELGKHLEKLTLSIDESELRWNASLEGTPAGEKNIVLDRLEVKPFI